MSQVAQRRKYVTKGQCKGFGGREKKLANPISLGDEAGGRAGRG